MSRFDRLQQIEQLLLSHPEGLSRADIARRLGVHRSTVGRDIDTLGRRIPVTEDDTQRLYLDRHSYLTTIRLTMFELESLHLAARLFARVMKFPFPYASSALRKLADAQGRVSLRLADRMRKTADEIDSFPASVAGESTRYREIVERLGTAITDGRPVRAHHYSRNHNEVREYYLYPLTLEPHHEGRAVHLLAWQLDGSPPAFRTLKIERIHRLDLEQPAPELLEGIPLDEVDLRLSRAWSIWTTNGPAVQVVLRFSSAVADRVMETLWHTSQELAQRNDGSVIWSGRVAEPREMYPWIRGWGPDVEVLEPQWLREQHRCDFAAGEELYRETAGRETDV